MTMAVGALPVFQRQRTQFVEVFGVEAADVVGAMNGANDDPASRRPRMPLDLQSVGYARSDVPIQLLDPFGSERMVPVAAAVKIGSAVPRTRRGLHMSRIGDVVARSVTGGYGTLVDYAQAVAAAVSESQYGGPTVVSVRARVPYLEQVVDTQPREKLSLEHLTLLATVSTATSGGGIDAETGVRVTHIVACPCVQRMYAHARGLTTSGRLEEDAQPGFTHSQRCVTTVLVRGLCGPLPVPRLLTELDSVLVRTMNTLPRGSELALVHRAHVSPQFVEDALRDALWAACRAVGRTASFRYVRGYAKSCESIHDFDLSASARMTLEDAQRCWDAQLGSLEGETAGSTEPGGGA